MPNFIKSSRQSNKELYCYAFIQRGKPWDFLPPSLFFTTSCYPVLFTPICLLSVVDFLSKILIIQQSYMVHGWECV